MIADMMDRRITRSLSNELQKRTDAQSQSQSQSQLQTQASILNDQSGSRTDISVTEAEAYGKDFSMFSRNSSEEILLKSLMEGSMSIAAPSLEAMGFKSLPPANRGDSEELFNSWLLNAENHGYSSTHIAHRTRQASRRISSELVALLAQQTGSVLQKTNSFEHLFQGNPYPVNEMCNDSNQFKLRNGDEKGASASDLFLSKTWLQSSQPMTRSRSSELRRRYAAMQGMLAPAGVEASQGPVGRGICNAKLETMSLGSFSHNIAVEQSNQQPAFLSPFLSSMVPFNMQAQQAVDSVSSVVSMLKGTLERKKLGTNHFNNVVSTDNPFSLYGNQEAFYGIAPNSNSFLQIPEPLEALQTVQLMKMKDEEQLLTVAQSPREKEMDCSDAQPNQMQASTMSQEPSQSESSAAAPGLSTGVTICEDPVNSGQTLSRCESSMKWVADGDLEQNSKDKGFCESQFEGFFKTSSKKANHLTRMGSVTSSGRSVDKEDLTKKRRVERQRKMAEAKGRNHIPVMPSDVQAVLKRCEALEKEVRSLKLNLSFMNRKDSEQTKQIEELQKHNEDLLEEKERLLEEIERFTSEKGGI